MNKPSRRHCVRLLAALSAVAGVLALAGPAAAAPRTVSATVGPVQLPGVPVSVCVNNGTTTCTTTPPAGSVSLTASATINPGAVTVPTVTPGLCSNGQGVALVITTGSAGTVISGSVTVAVNGTPTVIPIGVPATPAGQTVILSACATPGVGIPGVPTAPGLPGVPSLPGAPSLPGVPSVPGIPSLPGVPTLPSAPAVPGIPGVGGLISGLLNTVLGLLVGVPAPPALSGLPV